MTWKMRPIVTRHRGQTWRRDTADTRGCHEAYTTSHGPKRRALIIGLTFAIGLIVGLWDALCEDTFVTLRMIITVVAILTGVLMWMEKD